MAKKISKHVQAGEVLKTQNTQEVSAVQSDVATLQQQVQELQAELRRKDLELKRFAAVSLLKQDPRYRHVVWLDESQVGLVGVAFRRPANCKPGLKAFVALVWPYQVVFDARLVGNGILRLEPPQVPGPNDTWRPTMVWSDGFKAKLQADVLKTFQRWHNDGGR